MSICKFNFANDFSQLIENYTFHFKLRLIASLWDKWVTLLFITRYQSRGPSNKNIIFSKTVRNKLFHCVSVIDTCLVILLVTFTNELDKTAAAPHCEGSACDAEASDLQISQKFKTQLRLECAHWQNTTFVFVFCFPHLNIFFQLCFWFDHRVLQCVYNNRYRRLITADIAQRENIHRSLLQNLHDIITTDMCFTLCAKLYIAKHYTGKNNHLRY